MYSATKSIRLASEIDFYNLDFLGLTETWQRFSSDNPLREMAERTIIMLVTLGMIKWAEVLL